MYVFLIPSRGLAAGNLTHHVVNVTLAMPPRKGVSLQAVVRVASQDVARAKGEI